MADLFNHRIDVKSNKSVDITKMASNSFRGMQIKLKEIVEDIKEDIVEIKDEIVEIKDEVIEKVEDIVEDIIEDVKELIDEDVEVEDFLSIDDLKVSELKEILDSKGVEYTATKKDDLIAIVKGL